MRTPITPLARAVTTLNHLAAAGGLMNRDYLGTRDEQITFMNESLEAIAAISAAMRLVKNHPELADELDELTREELAVWGLSDVRGRQLESP